MPHHLRRRLEPRPRSSAGHLSAGRALSLSLVVYSNLGLLSQLTLLGGLVSRPVAGQETPRGTSPALQEPKSRQRPGDHRFDPERDHPLDPNEALGRMSLPDGFHVTLFAAEPTVRQPIAMALDDRARLWVVECYSYPDWRLEGHDRVLVLEDADGDGRSERQGIFLEDGANLSGIELGYGGVWLAATPYLLFVPDRDGDGHPDGPAERLLDGWDLKANHNVFNGLTWGPDGWLYGLNGILSNSRVGAPGAPDEERVAINCGVWRYHPVTHAFEAVAHGTTNPWGLDFNELGDAFISNCVIPHLFHVIPGAHFQRMFGQDILPSSYELLESCADHLHWAGGAWQSSRGGTGKHGEAGGGHAHAGAMVYLGDNWPAPYRGGIFLANIHGNRINHDALVPAGSGYVARHEPDMLFANDTWFRGLELLYGPDGGVFVLDWSDSGECHETDAHGAHRESGRIYKVVYGSSTAGSAPAPTSVSLRDRSSFELAGLVDHPNEWHVRMARRLLAERASRGQDVEEASARLLVTLDEGHTAVLRLRALWALYAMGSLPSERLEALLDDPDAELRRWAVRLLHDARSPTAGTLARCAALGRDDPSPRVRLELASALQRMPLEARWAVARGLVSHGEDANDANLPLMVWYGIEALVAAQPGGGLELLRASRLPRVSGFIARRLTGHDDTLVEPLLAEFVHNDDRQQRVTILEGILAAARGRRALPMPPSWKAVRAIGDRSAPGPLSSAVEAAGLLFGDAEAVGRLSAIARDGQRPAGERLAALGALVERRVDGLGALLVKALDDDILRAASIRGLGAIEDGSIPATLLGRYAAASVPDRQEIIGVLASRPAWALELLGAVERGDIPSSDVSVYTARALQALGSAEVSARLAQAWGVVRPTSAEKSLWVDRYKGTLTPARIAAADVRRGRAVFDRTCASCHRLFDHGNAVGPELTGSNRTSVDYVLENVLDPSAVVARDYKARAVVLRSGRVVVGVVKETTEAALVLQTPQEVVTLARDEIEAMDDTNESLMPEGLFQALSEEDLVALFAYLASPVQAPPAE